jgi:hypothetical protein
MKRRRFVIGKNKRGDYCLTMKNDTDIIDFSKAISMKMSGAAARDFQSVALLS